MLGQDVFCLSHTLSAEQVSMHTLPSFTTQISHFQGFITQTLYEEQDLREGIHIIHMNPVVY